MAEVLTVLAFVSSKLSTFLSEKGRVLGVLRQEVQLISDEFCHMKAFLEVAESIEEQDPQFREWIRQVREAAYDTEDVLDEFMFLFACHRPHGFHGSIHWSFNSIKNLPARHQLATKLQSLKDRIKNISEARLRYESHHDKISARFPGHLAINHAWKCSKDDDALLAEEAQLVGIDKSKQHLISSLIEGDSHLNVIAVLGMGGLGKTTLVKNVHDDADVKNHFQIHAWITVSQICDFQELLKDLIRQLQAYFKKPVLQPMESMDIYQLKAQAKDFLQRARYAIVFDDVWDTEFWDAFKFVLPENRYGGNRVVLTTRVAEVAFAACQETHGHVYKMECLTFQESWTLFCRKTFKDNCCPAHLENVVKVIVGKCKGLPLAIVAISGLLALKDLSRIDEWELVRRRLGDEFEGTGKLDRAKKILRLSYNDLPSTLKTCLLYTSIYPEDHKISCVPLIQLWIAEGFVERREGQTAEEVAWDYLKELANRSLIQVSELLYDGLPDYFHIHDLLRDVIVSESREQNMMTIVSTTQQTRTRWVPDKVVRCLVLHNNLLDNTAAESHHYFKNLRTIITFGRIEPPSKALLNGLFSGKSLKVLHFGGMHLEEIPKEIFNLFYLKYLNLTGTRVQIVPRSIKRLQNLEYLDLSWTKVSELPKEILQLQKLRHLLVHRQADSWDLTYCGFKSPCEVGGLLELQTLATLDAAESDEERIFNELGKLSQLRKLGIINLRRENGKEFCSLLEKLKNLQELRVVASNKNDDVILDVKHSLSPSSLQYICFLSLRGCLEKMPPWIGTLLRLEKLHLTLSNLTDDPLKSLQHLPNLVEVSLSQAYQGKSLCFKAGGFLKLNKLYLRKMKGLRWVRMEEGALPRIEQLILRELPLLEELPFGIENLSQLQKFELWAMSSELTKKLEDEVFEESEDYRKISHIPQVRIGFQKDGEWRSRQLSQKKKTQSSQSLGTVHLAKRVFGSPLSAFALKIASGVHRMAVASTPSVLPSQLLVTLCLLFVVFFLCLFLHFLQ